MARDQAATLRAMRDVPISAIGLPRRRAIAVTGGKGGVGKSTLAVNLACHYANRGSRTLTLDGDLGMADLNLLLGVAPDRSLLDVLRGAALEEVLIEAHGVHLVPALNGSHQLANLDPADRRTLLREISRHVSDFHSVVVDTAAGIADGAMVLAGLASDVVVVATPEPLSLADAYACLKVLATRHGVTRALLVPNAIRVPSDAARVVDQLSGLVDRFLGIELIALPYIPHDPAVQDSAGAGIPLVLHHPDAPAARAIQKIARTMDGFAAAERPSFDPHARWRSLAGDTHEEVNR